MGFTCKPEPVSIISKSDIGILIIHGFSSTTQTMSYLIKRFSQAGYNIEAPILTGHHGIMKDFAGSKYEDWINDVENALFKLQGRAKNIFVIGLSMGGTLGLYLAESHPNINGIVLINHALFMDKFRTFFVPIVRRLAPFFKYKPIGDDVKDENNHEDCYDRIPITVAYEYFRTIGEIKKKLKNVDQPVLIFKSIEDHVILVENANYTLENIASEYKEIIWLKRSYHVATLDNDKDLICDKSIEFFKKMS